MARTPRVDYLDIEKSVETKKRHLQGLDISDEAKAAIFSFVERQARDGLSLHRQAFYLTMVGRIAVWMGDAFLQPTREDVEKVVDHVEKQGYEEWTRTNYRTAIKRFYKWHIGNDETYPPAVAWIKTRRDKNSSTMPEDLLTPAEIRALVKACVNPRDRALVGALYDSGCRIGEILNMRIKDLILDEYGAVFHVSGKTGSRRVRVVGDSVPLVSAWLEVHPARTEPSSPLWVGIDKRTSGRAMKYANASRVLKHAAEKAGIKKRINPHLFRHTRATELARTVSEAPLEAQMGWVHGSGMTRQYVHLSGKDVDREILRSAGIDVPEDAESSEVRHLPTVCPRCESVNLHDNRFCRRCGMALTRDAALEVDAAREKALGGEDADMGELAVLLDDPKVKLMFELVRKIRG